MNKTIQFCLLSFLLITGVSSCSSETNIQPQFQNSSLVLEDSLSFRSEMSLIRKNAGIFLDKQNKREFAYCYNTVTSKNLRIFDMKTNLIDEVQLDSLLKKCNIIDGINMISLDTIIAFSRCDNTLYYFNSHGHIFSQLNIDEQFQKNKNDYYHFYVSRSGDFILDNSSIVLHAVWGEDSSKDLSGFSYLEYIQDYVKTYSSKPKMLVINGIFDEKPNYIFNYNVLPYVFEHIDSTAYFGGSFGYNLRDNQIMSWNHYSDKIMVLDSNTNVLSKNTVVSNKSEIGQPYLLVSKDNIDSYNDTKNNLTKTAPSIGNTLYDSKQNIYYVKVFDKITTEWLNENKYHPWSLLIYDDNFNKLDEISFSRKKHWMGMMKISSLGLMIEVKEEITDYKNQELKFEIYNYEK